VTILLIRKLLAQVRQGRTQKHATEETAETEDFGVYVAGENSSRQPGKK
jgi:hypothetical protein